MWGISFILGPFPSYPLKCNEKDKEALNLPTNLSTVEFDRIHIILNDTAFKEIQLTLFTNRVLFKYKKFIHCHRHCHYHCRYPIPLSFKILLTIEVIHEIALPDSRFHPSHFLPLRVLQWVDPLQFAAGSLTSLTCSQNLCCCHC